MNDSVPSTTSHAFPGTMRPLLGQTILVVEDSRYACDAMRLMCLRSGARMRRADCLKSAHRHLRLYRPSVIVVDLGLPDGNGADLIAELSQNSPRIGVILGTSGDDSAGTTALDAGADGFLAKPLTSLAEFQTAILDLLPADRRPAVPVDQHDQVICPDPLAYQDDITHIAELLTEPSDDRVLGYAAQFIGGIARAAGDHVLEDAARDLTASRSRGAPVTAQTARLVGLVQNRLQQREAI